eukprot:scaffold82584_cov60-Phaeocystis_antarctica.AAC.4
MRLFVKAALGERAVRYHTQLTLGARQQAVTVTGIPPLATSASSGEDSIQSCAVPPSQFSRPAAVRGAGNLAGPNDDAPLWPGAARLSGSDLRLQISGLGAQISDELRERLVVGGAEAGGRVPAGDGIEAFVGRAALVVGAEADVLEARGVAVDERVEEAHWRFARGEAQTVEPREDARDHRAGS